jgi:ABC-2 type transport system permease protein
MMREIAAIVRKDLRQAKRDPRFMAPSLIIPFVFLLVYVVMWNSVGGGESFTCGLVVRDTSPQADDMANIIENMVSTTNHTWFKIERYDLATASQLYQDTQLISYILIPAGFGANISSGQRAKVVIFINNANDDVVKNYVHRIETAVFLYNQGAVYPDFNQSGARIILDESFSLQATPSNVSYMAAVGILLSLMTCSIAGQALLTATEFETGAIQDTLNSPVSRVALVIGRTIAAIPRSFAVLLITIPVICLSLSVFPIGNLLVLTGILLLTVLAMVPIGELIGMKTKKREQALLASVLITVMAFLGGGGIAPIGLIPASLRTILELIPMTYSFSLWTRVFFLDTVLGLWKGSLFLIATWIVMSAAVVLLLKREVERI